MIDHTRSEQQMMKIIEKWADYDATDAARPWGWKLARLVAAESDTRVAEAELKLGRAWHSMAIHTVKNALIDSDEPEIFSPFNNEVRTLIHGMITEAIKNKRKKT